jgi:acyl carrier protein
MPDEITEKVISTLATVKRVPPETIKPDSSLADLGIDSLDTFTLLFELESKFNISIPDDEARNIRTVNDIVEGVRKLLAAQAGPSMESAQAAE